MAERILVVDDQTAMQDLLTDLLEQRGAEPVAVGTVEDGLEMVSKSPDAFDLVILDLDFGEGQTSGLAGLEEIKKINPSLPVVILTGKGTISTAVEAIKLGAQEYVEKDFYIEENMELALTRLNHLIRATIDNKRLRREREFYREELKGQYNIVGKSRVIQQVHQQIAEVASIPRPVLIRGERGTGKELSLLQSIITAIVRNARSSQLIVQHWQRDFLNVNSLGRKITLSQIHFSERDALCWRIKAHFFSTRLAICLLNFSRRSFVCWNTSSLSGLAARRR